MAKINVLDTSVLLSAGKAALYSFKGEDVVIPLVCVRELESKRNDPELGLAARSVLRALDELRATGDLKSGVALDGGGTVRIEVNHITDTPDILKNHSTNDSRIITVAYALAKENPDLEVVLFSKDLPLKVIASLANVRTEDFVPRNLSGDFIDNTESYPVTSDQINELHAKGSVVLDLNVPRNVGIILRDENDPKHTALVISKARWTFEKVKEHKVSKLAARSAEQTLALDYLMDPTVKIVSLGGRAGTGKTTLALAAGLEQTPKEYKKIVVFRSMHAVGGEELGFLPGTEAEKLDPWTAAIYDSMGSFLEKQQIVALKSKGLIEVLPLTHIRGRNFTGTFIIIDEAQNLSRATILTALSRLGHGSKAVLSWDVAQRDNFRVGRHDGVYEVTSRLLGEKLFAHTSLKKSERSDVAELVSRKLDDFDLQ